LIPSARKRDDAFKALVKNAQSSGSMKLLSLADLVDQPRQRVQVLNAWVRQSTGFEPERVIHYILELAQSSERRSLMNTWSRHVYLPKSSTAQLHQLEESMASIGAEQQRPFRDALIRNRGDDLSSKAKARLGSAQPFATEVNSTAPPVESGGR